MKERLIETDLTPTQLFEQLGGSIATQETVRIAYLEPEHDIVAIDVQPQALTFINGLPVCTGYTIASEQTVRIHIEHDCLVITITD